MWEILPDNETARAILEGIAYVVLVILALGLAVFGLAFLALGLEKLKRAAKRLLGRPEVLALAEGIAAVNVTRLHTYVDDPSDALIILLAQQFRQDPAAVVHQVDRIFTIFGQLQLIWPQVRDALGIDPPGMIEQPPKPAETMEPATTP